VLKNGGFEGTGSWTPVGFSQRLTYNFANTVITGPGPKEGTHVGSVTYSAATPAAPGPPGSGPPTPPVAPEAWFNQAVTLKAGKRYDFSGYAKASSANPGCGVTFFVGTGNQANVVSLKTLGTVASNAIGPQWVQRTGFYVPVIAGSYTFNVRITCAAGPAGNAARTYSVDDLKFIEAL